MTAPLPPATATRLEIGRVTLHGYSPSRRDHFALAIQARLVQRGAPEAAARQAAAAILRSVDAWLAAGTGGQRHD